MSVNLFNKLSKLSSIWNTILQNIHLVSICFRSSMMETWLLMDVFKHTVGFIGFLLYLLLNWSLKFITSVIKVFTDRNFSYETSAQLQRVLWRRKLFIVDQTLPRDFLTWPISVVNPNYILKPNVSLYAITKSEAVFVETSSDIDIYKSDINPFLYMSQFKHCQRVVTMPIESLHKVASEIGSLSGAVVWLSNTARCGSTIIGQLFESVPSTVLISESDALINLSYLRLEGHISQEEYEKLFVSIIKIICKPHPGTKRICIKPRSCAMIHMESVSKLFPEIKQLFLYRNSLETLSSLLDFTFSDGMKRLIRYCNDSDVISWFIPYFRKRLHKYMAFISDKAGKPPCGMNTVETVAVMWASFICLAREMKSRDENIVFVKYETLVSDPKDTCRHIFDISGIHLSETDKALTRLKKHSQKKGVDFEDSKKKDPWRNLSKENQLKCNVILKIHNVPLLGENVYL